MSGNTPPDADTPLKLPPWLRRPMAGGGAFTRTGDLIRDLRLHTVCSEANCPNRRECFSAGTATFLLMGPTCTRTCAFCNISPARPAPLDPDEPRRIAEAAARLRLTHVVITSVTRDDLPDGGAAHFAAAVLAVRAALPKSTVEVLIPDFQGSETALEILMRVRPEIINHNVETHPVLYGRVRPEADYARSLELLARVARSGGVAKSGFMVGLGESDAEVEELLRDLKDAGCSIVTVGQYLRPSRAHAPVARYVPPEVFDDYARKGREMGLAHVFAAPLVRSSYMAGEVLAKLRESRKRT